MKGTKTITAALLSLVLGITGCGAKQATSDNQQIQDNKQSNDLAMRKTYSDEEIRNNGWEKATFGGGCFWCTEAIFEEVKGVKSVVSGYAGGKMEKPTYEAVCTDTTGHAECVQVVFDPKECAFATILDVHMKTHDPTTLNRQGNDVGIQYRSVVFYENDAQKTATEDYINKLNASGYYSDKIVTEVVPLTTFWPAETYHQDYFAKNPDQPYCVYVVAKKVDKFEHLFPELIEK
ncbi:MAG TPA: peptide-methionine (S)-S-oxide reductase MsrA [Chitinophagales bacterium]|nr:peptide-methionine (S)-S-oxide reductase MsrA [Chitinophagales bacterium]HNJ89275.1 peptide-methionine (S)-S-oxide reductase MsrA [Chitinophagales bacterium]